MNRQQKEQVIESLKGDFQDNSASFVVGVEGLTVHQLESLRGGLREKGGKLKIAKVRLAKQAISGLDNLKEFEPLFKQQLGFVFTGEQAPAIAKVLYKFSKENEALELVAGYFENSVLDKDSVIEIASLPSREELITMIARLLNEPVAKFARAVQAVSDKKAEEGGEPEPAPAASDDTKAESDVKEESKPSEGEDKAEEKKEVSEADKSE
ncbi:50S ribosomal protein L10 [bacterium]|jgi:large subunit ribosomal protein L10|nr:50S ribosomal protein L10 [bacterium]MBT5015146.1 50S ribosomal protein L10 [bacterium]